MRCGIPSDTDAEKVPMLLTDIPHEVVCVLKLVDMLRLNCILFPTGCITAKRKDVGDAEGPGSLMSAGQMQHYLH